MLKTILITVLIVAISMALFSVKILFKKNGRFPQRKQNKKNNY